MTELNPALAAQLDKLRHVPSSETLELTDAGDVIAALGELETQAHELDLLRAWEAAGNRAALTIVAVHVPGVVGAHAERAARRLTPHAEEP